MGFEEELDNFLLNNPRCSQEEREDIMSFVYKNFEVEA
jgi:hypothetical protein